MKKYLFTIEWCDYEFFLTIEGESLNETPAECSCSETCYCKSHSCK